MFGVQGRAGYGKSLNGRLPVSRLRGRYETTDSKARSVGNNRVEVGTFVGVKYVDVAQERSDYCREAEIIPESIDRVGGDTDSDPFPRPVAEYLTIGETSIDMAKAERFDQDTRMANDMATAEDQWGIKICHSVGKEFIEITRAPRVLCGNKEMYLDRSDPCVEGEEGSFANFAKYLPDRNLKIGVRRS